MTDDTARALRKNGYRTAFADDGTLAIIDPYGVVALSLIGFRELPGSGRRVVADLVKILADYNSPLIRVDAHGFVALWIAERGRSAGEFSDSMGRTWRPSVRFTGHDQVVTLQRGLDGPVRLDGKWHDNRSPLTVPRQQISTWVYEAERDMQADIEAAFNTAHERGDLKWAHEVERATQVVDEYADSRMGVDAPVEREPQPDLRSPADIDPTDPIRFIPGAMDALRERRRAAGLTGGAPAERVPWWKDALGWVDGAK